MSTHSARPLRDINEAISDALHNVAPDHDPAVAVLALVAEAYDRGRLDASRVVDDAGTHETLLQTEYGVNDRPATWGEYHRRLAGLAAEMIGAHEHFIEHPGQATAERRAQTFDKYAERMARVIPPVKVGPQ